MPKGDHRLSQRYSGLYLNINTYLTDISLINKKLIKAAKINIVKILINKEILTLNNILYVFKLNKNLLLIKIVRQCNITVKFSLKNILFKHFKSIVKIVI